MGKFIVTLSIEVEVEAPTPDDAYDKFFEQAKWELMPKGVYCCEKCARSTQVFVRVFEVKCGQHGQMRRVK